LPAAPPISQAGALSPRFVIRSTKRFEFAGLRASEDEFANTNSSSTSFHLTLLRYGPFAQSFRAQTLLTGHTTGGAASIQKSIFLTEPSEYLKERR
jgi:hypothetical protein